MGLKMKNSSKIFAIIASLAIVQNANAQAYYRVEAEIKTPAPKPNNNNDNTQFYALNGQEIAPYAYGYVANLPSDGNWRWIEERCYQTKKGTSCIEGHWVRKNGKSCEEVSGHTIKTGKYTKIIKGGNADTCRK